MNIAWGALGQVLLAGLLVGAGAVAVFGIGVRGLSQVAAAREQGRSDPLGYGLAGLCFTACAAAVAYSIYLIVPQLH